MLNDYEMVALTPPSMNSGNRKITFLFVYTKLNKFSKWILLELSIIFILSLEEQLADKLRYKHKSARYYMSVAQKLVCPSLLLYEVHFKDLSSLSSK